DVLVQMACQVRGRYPWMSSFVREVASNVRFWCPTADDFCDLAQRPNLPPRGYLSVLPDHLFPPFVSRRRWIPASSSRATLRFSIVSITRSSGSGSSSESSVSSSGIHLKASSL